MSEKKKQIIKEVGKLLSKMSEEEKMYLVGFLEGFAAMVGVSEQGNNPKEIGRLT